MIPSASADLVLQEQAPLFYKNATVQQVQSWFTQCPQFISEQIWMSAIAGLKQPLGELEDRIQGFSKRQASGIFCVVCTTPVFVSSMFNVNYLARIGPSVLPEKLSAATPSRPPLKTGLAATPVKAGIS